MRRGGALLLFLAFAACGESTPAEGRHEDPLEARIQIAENPPKDVPVRFFLTNRGKEALYVLDWYTPLEGMQGDLFQVARDGKPVPYRSLMVKRGDPGKESYHRLEPGQSLEAQVPLAPSYDVSLPGAYTVQFVWEGRGDVCRDRDGIPRPRDAHEPPKLRSNVAAFTVP